MENIEKIQKFVQKDVVVLTFSVFISLIGFIVVKNVMSQEYAQTGTSEEKNVEESHPIKVYLTVIGSETREYDLRMNSSDSIGDFLMQLIREEDFIFEVEEFSDKTVFKSVNGVEANQFMVWELRDAKTGELVNNTFEKVLEDGDKFTLQATFKENVIRTEELQ